MNLLLALLMQTALAKDSDVEVIFFGGHHATARDMACWEKGAKKDPRYAGYKFRGIAYPVNGPAVGKESKIRQAGQTEIEDVLRYLRKNKNKHVILVGHSNGSVLANAVAAKAPNSGRLELINLDGYPPDAATQDKVETKCFYAAGKAKGFMTNSIRAKCERSQALIDNHCASKHCAHFSLINKSAPANLSRATYGAQGYRSCNTNLAWLDKGGTRQASAAPAPSASR